MQCASSRNHAARLPPGYDSTLCLGALRGHADQGLRLTEERKPGINSRDQGIRGMELRGGAICLAVMAYMAGGIMGAFQPGDTTA